MVEPLFLLLSRPDFSPEGQHSALQVLVNILEHPQCRADHKLTPHQSIEPIIALLLGSTSQVVQQLAAELLSHLLLEEHLQKDGITQQAVGPLIQVLGSGMPILQQRAMKALANIALTWPNAIAKEGGVTELSKLILQADPPQPHALWESAASVLSCILQFSSEFYLEVPVAVLMQCVSYEKRIQELEQRLSKQYLQVHHVTDEKNASQSSLKNDNYGSVISAGTEGPGPYGSSDPMDEVSCTSAPIDAKEDHLTGQLTKLQEGMDENMAELSALPQQCVSSEKRIHELEQRLSEQYLQVHHVTDEKNASQSSLKNDNYGSVISAGTEGPGPYGSSDPMDEMQCVSYEKRIQKLEQRLSEQYLQVHHVTDEKNASQSSLKNDNYGSVISAGTEGPGPYGSSDPMDEPCHNYKQMQCVSYEKRIQELEQRLSERYLQVHHVIDEKNASQPSLKMDNYGSVISSGTEGPGPYGSSNPMDEMQCVSYEKRIQELEQRLSEQYLQVHHVTDEKNASQSSLKNDNYGSVISAGTEGPDPYGSSDPMDEMQCVSYEKHIQEHEQRLSKQYLQVHHVTDEKNASQSSLKNDNYGSVISSGLEGPGPYGSSDPMDEVSCTSAPIDAKEDHLTSQLTKLQEGMDENVAEISALPQLHADAMRLL
ncbi:Autophagy-related protein 11 [Nymphaea thermarum]|nr:Autophagy-related protein 11 [Nymphaea thermarum]